MSDLGLPDNGSYRTFADLGRRYATWNLFAAPELSVEPKRWCFPVAGCVSYRGYFDEAHAARAAANCARAASTPGSVRPSPIRRSATCATRC